VDLDDGAGAGGRYGRLGSVPVLREVSGPVVVDAELRARARLAGVATSYADWAGREVEVSAEAVEAALAAVGGPAQPAVVATPTAPVAGTVHLESGDTVEVTPGDVVPPGVHRLATPDGAELPLVAGPPVLPDPLGGHRAWGWQIQLYQLRSARSWGIGDYADLATLACATATLGAGVLQVNPLHAHTPVLPLENSPYYPSSRRHHDQLSIAIDRLPEYAAAGPELRARVDALRPPTREQIDRDEIWRAKRAALALLLPAGRTAGAEADEDTGDTGDTGDEQPAGLEGFAVFCALAEEHGPDWRRWPEPLRRPGSAVTASAHPDRVRLHRWLQIRAGEQLEAAQRAARDAGMAIGIVHDLAVGVDPAGADAWLLQDDLAIGTATGAPPDPFNQFGQDWGVPPLRPERLAATGFSAYRQVVRAALRHGGGLRVDHVMGLFRLWWVPAGRRPADGTYVRYDAAAMLAVLMLEAARTGALVVGEDLGTVDPAIRRALDRAGVLGSAVLWFAREEDQTTPLPPQRWRERAVATVSTHDLPTAYGFLAGEQVRVRSELGLLATSLAEETRRTNAEREAIVGLLRAEGLLGPDPSPDETVLAMYRLLASTPCRIVLASPADAVGDLRQANLPGTVHEYPNWRRPLADPTGRPVSLEEFLAAPGTARLATLLHAAVQAQPRR
jgi:4-alpha-glucanotransferase